MDKVLGGDSVLLG